jgi:hypothetical protein
MSEQTGRGKSDLLPSERASAELKALAGTGQDATDAMQRVIDMGGVVPAGDYVLARGIRAPRSGTVQAYGARGVITVRKARWGWWVDGRWCPTRAIRDHQIQMVRKRTGKTHVRTPG